MYVCVSTHYDVRTTTHFSERVPVVKRRISVYPYWQLYKQIITSTECKVIVGHTAS